MQELWQRKGDDWWLTDFSALPGDDIFSARALKHRWQLAPYEAVAFSGTMALANPTAAAPAIHIPLPRELGSDGQRYSIYVSLPENYCDRLLIKLEGEAFFDRLAHEPRAPGDQSLQECWWKDVALSSDSALVLQQDAAMSRRCGIAFVHICPAPEPTEPEFPVIATADGMPGNNGAIDLDEMLAEELQFAGTHVRAICHGTDISGTAQYSTRLAHHRYPLERVQEEEFVGTEYYSWTVEQLQKYEQTGRCPLRDSVEAAHRAGLDFYAYHRMAITRLFAPWRMFDNPLFDQHPEWRCIDWDGTPVSRLSIAYPEVRNYFLEHFHETVELGADGVCLVFSRGWPMLLFEPPVAEAYQRRTGKDMRSAAPDDTDLWQVRAAIFNDFMRDIRRTVTEAAPGRETKIVALPLATPAVNRHFAMDCATWARENLVQILCPYPYGLDATYCEIEVAPWLDVVGGTATQICPIVNRAPGGDGMDILERTERWLDEGVDGLSFWDLDSHLALPASRRFAYNIASQPGRERLRKIYNDGPTRYALKTLDGLAVDRYHPGWNV